MKLEIRSVGVGELPELVELLQRERLPTAGVKDHLDNYLVAEKSGQIVGMIGLEIYGNVGLLRSLAVVPAEKGTGVGKELMKAILRTAAKKRLESIYLLTTTAEGYFPRFGFERVSRKDVDGRLAASEELQGACPESAVCMRLGLS